MSKYDPNEASPYDSAIADAAARNGVNYGLLRKQLWLESRFKADAQSPTGPKGIAQFTKATGAAYGLSDSDRLDPLKSIDAAARHVSDLVKKFNGDELKAMLAYNVGEGPKGNPQLAAYDAGDFSKIGPEGLNYMRTLQDYAKSDRKSALMAFGGITPKADSVSAEDAFTGLEAKPKVSNALPESTGFSVEGTAQEAPSQPFAKSFWETHGETLDEANPGGLKGFVKSFEGTGASVEAGIKNSLLGVAVRAGLQDNSLSLMADTFTPSKWNSHVWSDAELEKIRNEVKDPRYISVVAGGSPENLGKLIELANQNYEYDSKASKGGLGAQVVGGLVGAAFDPVSYIPVVGTAGKAASIGGKVAKVVTAGSQAAGLNVVSEGLRTSVAGGEAHYEEAALGGLVLASGLTALGQTLGKRAPVTEMGHESVIDANTSTATRLEVRHDALTKGQDFDPSALTIRDGESLNVSQTSGVPYVDAPGILAGHGDVRLADGSIISGASPVNPKTLDALAEVTTVERAARGVNLSGVGLRDYHEVSMTIMRSESDAVRAIGLDLVRPTTGLQSGAGGKFGATASDVMERLKGTDHQFYNDLMDLRSEALKDVKHDLAAQGLTVAERSQAISRRVAEAVEDMTDTKASKLTKPEQRLVKLIRDHHDYKAEALRNPSMFGNAVDNNKALMTSSHFEGGYYPVRYDNGARSTWLSRFGNDVQTLKEAVKSSMIGSYNSQPHIKARVDAYLKTTGETVEAYAERKAFGIANANGDAAGAYRASGAMDDLNVDNAGLSNNDYLQERHLFGNDFEVTLNDGSKFSVNDLRHFEMEDVLPAYNRRVNGDIAILGGTGKTTAELVREIDQVAANHAGDPKASYEAGSLYEVVKVLTGRSRRDPEGALATMARALNDTVYTAKNAYMGLQNYTEIAAMVARGGTENLVRAIPSMGKYLSKNGKLNAKEASEVHAMLFGKELDDSIMPKRKDIVERLRMTGSGDAVANAVGSVKWATGRMAARFPMSRVMTATTNHIVKAARIETLGDIAAFAHGLRSKSLVSDGLRKSAAISDAQWSDIQALMREHTQVNPKTKEITFVNKETLRNDPRAMDLWRLADHVGP